MASSTIRPYVSERTEQRRYSDLRGQLIILGLFRFSEALAWTTIFPYVYSMMQSFLLETPSRDANAALYASLTVALFTFGEFLMGFMWAKISDSIGRKPTLLVGVIGNSISAAAFGFSQNIWMALGARVFGGLANPNVGVISAFVGELVKRKDDQGKAFSVVPFLRGLGSLIGPVVGGYLANPVTTLPSIFRHGTIWDTYPYLLPNLIVLCFIMGSGLLGFLFLEEVHPKFQHRYDIGLEGTRWLGRGIRSVLGQSATEGYTTISGIEDGIHLSAMASSGDSDELIEESSRKKAQSPEPESSLPTPPESASSTPRGACSAQAILQILALSILAFHKVSSDVIVPMFLATPLTSTPASSSKINDRFFKFNSGFGMDLPSISNVLLSQAVIAVFVQILVVPKIIRRWGALRSFRWAMFVFPWMYCLTPFTARLPQPVSTVAVLLDLWTKGLLVGLGYVCSAILLTNTTPSATYLARINGAAASLGCLARSLGALVSGSMFRFGLTEGFIALPFWTLGTLAASGAIISWCLRDKP